MASRTLLVDLCASDSTAFLSSLNHCDKIKLRLNKSLRYPVDEYAIFALF